MNLKPFIIYEARNVYGNILYYPLTQCEALRTLTGKKTLNGSDLKALENLGFEVFSKDQYFRACQRALNLN